MKTPRATPTRWARPSHAPGTARVLCATSARHGTELSLAGSPAWLTASTATSALWKRLRGLPSERMEVGFRRTPRRKAGAHLHAPRLFGVALLGACWRCERSVEYGRLSTRAGFAFSRSCRGSRPEVSPFQRRYRSVLHAGNHGRRSRSV